MNTAMIFKRRYRIRPAARGDLHLLAKIEQLAARRFLDYGLDRVYLEMHMAAEHLDQRQAEGRLWVAVNRHDRPVGFAAASIVDGLGHLDELDVVPAHGRRGLGGRLLRTVCVWAWRNACPGVTLSTLRGVPFNEPFYRRYGFEIVPEEDYSEGILRLRDAERRAGLPMDDRIIMRRDF